MKNKQLAPILLFVYNRPEHTSMVLESLKDNMYADKTKLYIFSDFYKNKNDKKSVFKVREIISKAYGFKSVKIIKRKKNLGLAKSIRSGVNFISKTYDSFIVLEDDIITNKYFIKFMNYCLNKYENNTNIWHISGWNFPTFSEKNSHDIYFDRMMNCWGWATWTKNWKMIDFNVHRLTKKFNKKNIIKFNLDGVENFFSHLLLNKYKIINTWAIFWFGLIFLNKGLCVRPKKSLTKNIGIDGSGVNCLKVLFSFYHLQKLSNFYPSRFRTSNTEDIESIKQIKKFYKYEDFFLLRYGNKVFEKIINIFTKNPLNQIDEVVLKKYKSELNKTLQF